MMPSDGLRQLALLGLAASLAVLVPYVVLAGVDVWLAVWAARMWRVA